MTTEYQQILDWRMVRGAAFTNAEVQHTCRLTPKQLYRQRKHLGFKQRGVFTYGEAVALTLITRAHIPLHDDTALALRALSVMLDTVTTDMDYVGIAYLQGVWRPYATHALPVTDVDVCCLGHLPTLSEALANAHAVMYNVQDGTQEDCAS